MNVFVVQMRNTNNNYNWENLIAFYSLANAIKFMESISKEYHSGKEYKIEKLLIKD